MQHLSTTTGLGAAAMAMAVTAYLATIRVKYYNRHPRTGRGDAECLSSTAALIAAFWTLEILDPVPLVATAMRIVVLVAFVLSVGFFESILADRGASGHQATPDRTKAQ